MSLTNFIIFSKLEFSIFTSSPESSAVLGKPQGTGPQSRSGCQDTNRFFFQEVLDWARLPRNSYAQSTLGGTAVPRQALSRETDEEPPAQGQPSISCPSLCTLHSCKLSWPAVLSSPMKHRCGNTVGLASLALNSLSDGETSGRVL